MNERTFGSICAGIGGFDLGFERAGWRTSWQIELDDVNRACLADRFPWAQRGKNLNDWRSYLRSQVISWAQCFAFGFPCQGISTMGQTSGDQSGRGLADPRSGLFREIMEIVREVQPTWLVIENVPQLLHINDGKDFQIVVQTLAQCGYVGYWRVLDAQYFGIPQKRRRLVMVAGLGRYPSSEFLADAGAMESLPCAIGSFEGTKPADAWAGYTLLASNAASRISMGSELFVAHEDGWDQMVERSRKTELYGVSKGLDASHYLEARGAGNAFPPQWLNGSLKL